VVEAMPSQRPHRRSQNRCSLRRNF